MHKKVKVVLKKLQENMKKYADKNKKKIVEYKVRNRVLLSTKDSMWQIRNRKTKKLMEKYVESYKEQNGIVSRVIEKNLISFSKDKQRKEI